MTRKPQTPNWSRLARTARVEASRLPVGSAQDALIAKARKLEAAGKRERSSSVFANIISPFGVKSVPTS